MTSKSPSLQLVALSIAIPYLLGWLLSPQLISEDHFSRQLKVHGPTETDQRLLSPDCKKRLSKELPPTLLEGLAIDLHHNGEIISCGTMMIDLSVFEEALQTFDTCLNSFSKYDFESWLTRVMDKVSKCGPTDLKKPVAPGFLGYCDRGVDKTPILFDHDRLVRIPSTNTLPCHFHTREGVRITTVKQFRNLLTAAKAAPTCSPGDTDEMCKTPSLPLYAVPAGRVFMFAPKFVGEIFHLPHVTGDQGAPISLEVLSLSPRVFDVLNFFSRDESANLVERALKETSTSHKIKRSTTGASGNQVNKRRTSESGFDTHGKVAVTVKKRCFKILGFDEYVEGHGDGLQILRYNLTTAYTQHMDHIDDASGKLPHNYDSAGMGGNRFSTILLYMSDLDEAAGGETVFTEAWPVGQPENERVKLKDALRELRESNAAGGILQHGSWEEEMVAKCRSRLAIRPRAGRAVLFYSQLPNGEPDPASLHGGCPVLKGEKYASNLWVWNTIRDGFPGAPRNPKVEHTLSPTPANQQKKTAVFSNQGTNPSYNQAELWYGDEMFWAKLGKGDPSVSVNTYPGHVWTLKVNGEVVKKWAITEKENEYSFAI
jgi:prolyl 4-hydroxylase